MSQPTIQYYLEGYSDFHKEAFGTRPRGTECFSWDLARWEKEYATLDRICEQNAEMERLNEQQAIIDFERTVEKTIAAGAGDRETAIRWLMDGERDFRMFCYDHGLPYNYFGQAV